MKTEIQNTLAEDLGMFFTLKFGECIIHPLPSDSSETTNVFCTKGEMNSKKVAIYVLTDIIPIISVKVQQIL